MKPIIPLLLLLGPATAGTIDNLAAFTRVLGYVRYFHPSEEAAVVDWDRFAVEAVRVVEAARTPEELAVTLEVLFRPVAPRARFYPAGRRPDAVSAQPKRYAMAWRHFGVGLGNPQSIYSSERVVVDKQYPQGVFGEVAQSIEAGPLRGQRARFRSAARAEGLAELWLEVDGRRSTRRVTGAEWRDYELAVPVDSRAQAISLGLRLVGEGKAWMDAVDMSPVVVNPDFEEPDLRGWTTSGAATVRLTSESPRRGRQCVLLSAERVWFPDPAQPYEVDLGAGVKALIPLALYADAPPVRRPAAVAPCPPHPVAAVALAWNVFQHFYPYFDTIQTDWPAALRRALESAAAGADPLATLRRMVAELGDGHANVLDPSEPKPFVPPLVWAWVEDHLVVTAGGAGLERGDVVVRVEGRPAAEAVAEREQFISGATPQWKRYHAVRVLLAGPRDSELVVEVGGRGVVRLRRTAPLDEVREARPEKVTELRPGTWYVDLDRAEDRDFGAALRRLAGARGIVFDLRGYPKVSPATIGHLIDRPVSSPQWFLPVVTHPDRRKTSFAFSQWTVAPRAPRLRAKIAFLTDGRAISYAETYLGIVEHYRLGEIVGEPTAGTNGNVNPFTLPGGYRVSWTGMKVLKQDGSRHHGVGIRPTIPVSRTIRGVRDGRDEALERALSVLP